MKRTIAALFAGGLSLFALAGLHSGVASAAEATAELDDGLLHWLVRSRWWHQVPGQPALPTLSDISHDSVTVSWAAPESTVFEIADYDVQYRAAGTSRYADWAHDGLATEATVTGLAELTEYEFRVRAVSEAGGGDWSSPAAGTTPIAPPQFIEGESAQREVRENTPGDEPVGEPVAANVREGPLHYRLDGSDAGTFRVEASNGQLRTRPGVDYDYETRSSYLVDLEASSERRGTARISVRISVVDVDEPPGKPDAPVVSALGSTALRVTWSAPENTGPAITGYDLEYRAGGAQVYRDGDHAGTETLATIGGLAHDTLYEVRVRAENDEGTGAWSDTTQERAASGGGGGEDDGTPGFAPVDQAAFDALFTGNFLSTPNYFILFQPGGRYRESNEHLGGYTYANTGSNTGTMTQTYDDTSQYGGSCTVQFNFVSRTSGTLSYTCAAGQSNTEDWRLDRNDPGSFDIEIIWSGTRRNAADNAVQAAVARWESVISEDIGAVFISSPTLFGVIDDIRINARIDDIDGPGGTLGRGGVRWIRTSSGLPAVSAITLDSDDVRHLSSGALYNVVTHEISHALGFGTRWSSLGLLKSPSGSADPGTPLPDTYFAGANAIAAFDTAGGASYTGAKVPVENNGDFGQVDSHWRISVFGYGELMVGSFSTPGTLLPMSAITVQSMADLGYTVNVSAADGYALPPLSSSTLRDPVRAATSEKRVPLKCIVIPPAPTDGVTLFELKSDPTR